MTPRYAAPERSKLTLPELADNVERSGAAAR